MKRILLVTVALWAILQPAKAYACSGFIDCLFGFSDRVETRQTQMTERERITADRDESIARIQAEADERVRQADIEIERVKQQQYQSEADRDIAIAQAQQQADQYKAMIAGLTAEKVAGIQSNADSQIAALQAQAQIAIAGINETGQTERWRVGGGWLLAVVIVVILGVVALAVIRRMQPPPVEQTVVLLTNPTQYRQLESHMKSLEVQNANKYLVKH